MPKSVFKTKSWGKVIYRQPNPNAFRGSEIRCWGLKRRGQGSVWVPALYVEWLTTNPTVPREPSPQTIGAVEPQRPPCVAWWGLQCDVRCGGWGGDKFSLGLFSWAPLLLNLQNRVFEKLSNYDGLTTVELHCLRSWVRILATVAENRVATTPSTQFDALGPLAWGS